MPECSESGRGPSPTGESALTPNLMSADNTFTRISPRQSQEYRVRTKYKPANWMSVDGSIRIWEGRDNIAEVNNLQHDRSYGFSATFQPGEKWALELGLRLQRCFFADSDLLREQRRAGRASRNAPVLPDSCSNSRPTRTNRITAIST